MDINLSHLFQCVYDDSDIIFPALPVFNIFVHNSNPKIHRFLGQLKIVVTEKCCYVANDRQLQFNPIFLVAPFVQLDHCAQQNNGFHVMTFPDVHNEYQHLRNQPIMLTI